jgi:four helix bundle protein
MQDYRSLDVWRESKKLAILVYEVTGGLPLSERFGLTSQMRRACVSIASNIAEGCGREGQRELARYLEIARASAFELEAQLDIGATLDFIPHDDPSFEACNKLKRSLSVLINRVKDR